MQNPVSIAFSYILSFAAILAFAAPVKAGPTTQATQTYRIDTQKSSFMVHTGTAGFLGAFGHKHNIAIPDFSGEIMLNPEALDQSTLRMQVKAASLLLTDKVSEKDRLEIEKTMREQVLAVDTFPEISFQSRNITASKTAAGNDAVKISGDLVLHGVTKSVTIEAQLEIAKDTLKAHGEFALKQTDFGIKPVTAAGGSVKVKDELKLSFEIVARP